ncbi:MAG: DinB family protein [Armatimonadota bacterium]|nr:DinB family protein [Armatimonadota bacterium]MDR7484089.1 DinB family protein [Armatimonadota bacterium]MDR7519329.1 DinB family protein [Armatimonadota bacterium]MDR7550800.1 DinB family protein [Armatimonadota bacterium]
MTRNDTDRAVRRHLLWLLRGGNAHAPFERAVAGLPARLRGVRPGGLPYSPWMLVEHMRIAQWDMLAFSRNPQHVSPKWPDEYWPRSPEPPNASAWQKSIAAWRRDLRAMQRLVADPKTDLFARFPHGDGQTVFLEAFQIADHNAYHIGQLIVVRRLLGAWRD